jgi:hypothetical protein
MIISRLIKPGYKNYEYFVILSTSLHQQALTNDELCTVW